MIKFILVAFLLSYVFIKVTGFLFRMLGGSHSSTRARGFSQQRYERTAPKDGNLNIDYVPKRDKKNSGKFKGGEYVDYEEVE